MIKKKLFGPLPLIVLLFTVTIAPQGVWGTARKSVPYRMSYVRPADEAVKVRDINMSTNLGFKSGSIVLNPAYGANLKDLVRIDSLVTAILNDHTIVLNTVSITGYSSPEGLYQTNEQLSKKRANSVKNYLIDKYPSIAESKYSVDFGGENWTGLYDMVLNSNTPGKARVLNIIQDVDVMKGRESQLMELDGGVPYKYILSNFFPALRKVDLKFTYNVRNFNLDEAAEIYKTNPKALSLAEIYNVADQYPHDSEEFRSMMIESATLFPQSDVANINASMASMLSGDSIAAEYHLDKASKVSASKTPSGDYYNALGVNQALSNKTDEAMASLEKGVSGRSLDAEYNLWLLNRHEPINDAVRDTITHREVINEVVKLEKPARRKTHWAMKTNLIYWLALQPNIETEIYFANRWSVNLEYQIAWWDRPEKHQTYQYMHAGVEGRYWFKPDGSFSGHHMGLYAGYGSYDLSPGHKSNDYEGYLSKSAFAAGISYGYTWRLNRSLWMETGIGVGYIMTDYHKYKYQDTNYIYQSTEKLRLFSPTKLRLTLIWRPQSKSKSKK